MSASVWIFVTTACTGCPDAATPPAHHRARSARPTPGPTCGSLLADLDVHPRVALQILRHANFKITMEIYTQVTDQQTRDALRRLGESLG